jgi:hypothetical protein
MGAMVACAAAGPVLETSHVSGELSLDAADCEFRGTLALGALSAGLIAGPRVAAAQAVTGHATAVRATTIGLLGSTTTELAGTGTLSGSTDAREASQITGEVPPCNEQPCDFLTGGGFIVRDSGAKANFGVGGGCKHDSPTWGHLEYIDHGTGLNVHWKTITAYPFVDQGEPSHGQPTGARYICGTARTNQFGNVDWAVFVRDTGEPGDDDELRFA